VVVGAGDGLCVIVSGGGWLVMRQTSFGVGVRCWSVVVGASDTLRVIVGGGGWLVTRHALFGVGVWVVVGANNMLRVW
jgi:hypothetical protein